MENNDEALEAAYANICADIIIGKNAALHLPVIIEDISTINNRIEGYENEGKDPAIFERLGYRLYKLKDDAEKLIAAGN